MRLVVVRHGQTQANVLANGNNVFCAGDLDDAMTDLTPTGVEQAKALVDNEAVQRIDRLLVSPLRRAQQTVRLACPGRPFTIVPALRERSLGYFEGKTKEEIIRENPENEKYFGDDLYRSFKHSYTLKAPGGESYADVAQRLREFLATLDFSANETVGLFMHECAMRCLLAELLGLEPRERVLRLRLKNCYPYIFESDSTGKMQLIKPSLEEVFASTIQ